MKKTTIILLVVILGASSTSFAQLYIKFGFNNANFYGTDNPYDSKNRFAFSGGINTQWFSGDHFALLFETIYLPTGIKVKDDINDFVLRNNYIQWTLKPRYYINDEDIWSKLPGFYINAGPYASYLLSSKASGSLDGTVYDKFNMKPDYENWDFGITMGAGISFLRLAFLEFNYNLGLTQISNNLDIKNNSWGISIMIVFAGIEESNGKYKIETIFSYL